MEYLLDRKHFNAYIELTLSMLFLGVSLVIAKALIVDFPIFILLAIRFLIGSIYFVIAYFLFKKTSQRFYLNSFNKKDWLLLFSQSFFGAFLFNIFILLGMKLTTVGSAAILTSMLPAVITGFSFIILKEFISKEKLIALSLAIIGLLLVTVDISSVNINLNSLAGNGLILLAVISGALFPICVKLLGDKVSPLILSLFFNLCGLLLLVPITILDINEFKFSLISLNSWLLAIFYSFLANILYVIFWNRGLLIVPASTASIFTAIMPISATFLAYFFLNENLTLGQLAGMFCIILSIVLSMNKSKTKENELKKHIAS